MDKDVRISGAMKFGSLYKIYRTLDIYLRINIKDSSLTCVSGKHYFMPIEVIEEQDYNFIKLLCTDGNIYYKQIHRPFEGVKGSHDVSYYFSYYFILHNQEE